MVKRCREVLSPVWTGLGLASTCSELPGTKPHTGSWSSHQVGPGSGVFLSHFRTCQAR